MKSLPSVFCLCAALATALPAHAGQSCEVKSGAATAALVELYTSEGCSSCPPADQQLRQLRRQLGPDALFVPLALHVTYWDRIGWQDPYAQPLFDARQGRLLEGRRPHIAYTPQFFVDGSEVRRWQDDLPALIRRTNARPAPLTVTLRTALAGVSPGAAGKASLKLEAQVHANDPHLEGALYLALSESQLTSHVLRGENAGAALAHDDTVRLWFGPVALAQGQARQSREIVLPAAWQPAHMQAVAFVQRAGDARILQAVSSAPCAPAAGGGAS